MLAEMHGKYIVLLVGAPEPCSVLVPTPVVEKDEGVRAYDTYAEAMEAKAKWKEQYPRHWYSIAKVNIPKEMR